MNGSLKGIIEGIVIGAPVGYGIYRYMRSMSYLALKVWIAERRLTNAVMVHGTHKLNVAQRVPYCGPGLNETREIDANSEENLFVWGPSPHTQTLICVKTDSYLGLMLICISRPDCCIWRSRLGGSIKKIRHSEENYLEELVAARKMVIR